MGKVIKVDFLFARLYRDIIKWYDKYYFGKDIVHRKNVHLTVLKEKYDDRKFSTTDPVLWEKEVVSFLGLVQANVDGYTF